MADVAGALLAAVYGALQQFLTFLVTWLYERVRGTILLIGTSFGVTLGAGTFGIYETLQRVLVAAYVNFVEPLMAQILEIEITGGLTGNSALALLANYLWGAGAFLDMFFDLSVVLGAARDCLLFYWGTWAAIAFARWMIRLLANILANNADINPF